VLNARGLVGGCVKEEWKFTPQARVIYMDNKRVEIRMIQIVLKGALVQ
jgi:hypothetical protein